MPEISFDAHNVEGQPMFQMLTKARKLEDAGRKIFHFEIGDPHFDTPKHITDKAVESLRAGNTHYVNSAGIAELRDTVCKTTEMDLGFLPAREQVVITPGANSMIYFSIRCCANRSDEVIVPDPEFTTYYSALKFAGVRAVRIPLREENEFRMNPDEIQDAVTDKTKMIVINSPNNPTGAVISKREIEEIADIAKEHDVFILSDEIYRKVAYDKKPYSPSVIDKCMERTIILNGFSKSHAMTGWRIGYGIGPKEVMKKIGLTVETIVSCVQPFIQKAAITALKDQKNVKAMVSEFKKRRDIIVKGLNSLPGVSCLTPPGAFYVFPNIKNTGMTSQRFSDFMLEKAGVALLPGPNFGEHAEGYARLCYTQPVETINEAIGNMKKALEEKE